MMEMQHSFKPDADTGKCPTARQLEVIVLLNPFDPERCKTYDEVADMLGVTHQAVCERMKRFKERCPNMYRQFRECRFKQHKHWHKEGCRFCGRDISLGQAICFLCWKHRAMKENPQQYHDYQLYPIGGGVTRSTVDWNKDRHNWEINRR